MPPNSISGQTGLEARRKSVHAGWSFANIKVKKNLFLSAHFFLRFLFIPISDSVGTSLQQRAFLIFNVSLILHRHSCLLLRLYFPGSSVSLPLSGSHSASVASHLNDDGGNLRQPEQSPSEQIAAALIISL